MLSRSSLVPLAGCGVALVLTGDAMSGHLENASGSGWLTVAATLLVISVGCLLVVIGSGRVGATRERTSPARETEDEQTRQRAQYQWAVASGAITAGMVASLSSRLADAWTDGTLAWSTPLVLTMAGTLVVCVLTAIAVAQFRREGDLTARNEQAGVDQTMV